MLFLLFVLLFFVLNLEGKYLNLGSNNGEWKFYQSNYKQIKQCFKAKEVPGDIFTDIESHMNESMLFGNNDQIYSWIGKKSWIYERNFTIEDGILTVNFFEYYKKVSLFFKF